ncbi:MAG: methyltransferase domain-containing protein [Caldilineaceae bacterium]
MNPYLKLPKVPLLSGRQDFLVDIARGQRVLHLGCVDTGLLHERFEQGQLLHQKLEKVAKELWGFDIDQEGIDFLRSRGFDKLLVGDVSYLHEYEELKKAKFDIILAGEVVEHLQNPGLFFQSVKALMAPGHTRLVVSVPNAFRIDTLFYLLRGIEYVHPDHNYWFSYLTITNLFKKNDFAIEQVYVYTFHKHNLLPQGVQKFFPRHSSATPSAPSLTRPQIVNESAGVGALASTPVYYKLLSYLRALPKRLLVSFLYSRTPFWGDGLIVVATTGTPTREN